MNITNLSEAVASISKKSYENRSFKLFGNFKTPATIQLREKSEDSADTVLRLIKAESSKFFAQESQDGKEYWTLINSGKIVGNIWINVDEPNEAMLKEIVSKTELVAEL